MAGRGGALDFLGLDSSIRMGGGAINAVTKSWSIFSTANKDIQEAVSKDRAASASSAHTSIVTAMNKLRTGANDAVGRAVDRIVDDFLVNVEREIKSAGGVAKVSKRQYSNILNDTQERLAHAAARGGVHGGETLKRNAELVGVVSSDVRRNGLHNATGTARKLHYSSIEAAGSFDITRQSAIVRKDIATALRDNKGLPDALKQSLVVIRSQLGSEMSSASSDEARIAAIANAKSRIESARGIYAKDPDTKKVLDKLAEGIRVPDARSLRETRMNVVGAMRKDGIDMMTKGLGRLVGTLGIATKVVSGAIGVFQKTNAIVNSFGRQQIAVLKERGAVGRMIHGAGINPRELMTALYAGRKAGMDDATIISQQVSLQRELANARWGESQLTEAVGRWGGSTYNVDGTVKSQHEMMLEFSRILNSLGSKAEKLQFLGHIGYRPEQMEMISNYATLAAKNERIRKDERLQGTLERSNILDETGYYARADAATKIEYRRREILNQNALDEGWWSYAKRMVNPENWLFQDYEARQVGVAAAKSDSAMEALSKELRELTAEVRKNGGVIGEGSLTGAGTETKLTNEQLKSLSTASGWAEASKKNLGDKSPVYILEKALRGNGLKSEGERKHGERKLARQVGAGAAGGVGLWGGAKVGGLLGTKIGGAIGTTILPGPGTAIGATVGALAGGVLGGIGGLLLGTKFGGDAGEEVVRSGIFGDVSKDIVNDLYKAAKSDDREEFERVKKKYGVEGLKRSQVLDNDFDMEVVEGAKIMEYTKKAMELAGGKEVDLSLVGSDPYLGTMTAGLEPGSAEFTQRLIEAIARTSGANVGTNEAVARILKSGISVEDPKVAARIDELKREMIDKGVGVQQAGEKATQQAVQEATEEIVKDKNVDIYAGMRKEYENEYKDYTSTSDRVGKLAKKRRKKRRSGKRESYGEWLDRMARLGNEDVEKLFEMDAAGKDVFRRDKKGNIIGLNKLSQQEYFTAAGYGTTQEEADLKTYRDLEKKGLADKVDFSKTPDSVKNYRIQNLVSSISDGKLKEKDSSREFRELGDDAYVEWMAMKFGTNADDIRNNILTEKEYARLKKEGASNDLEESHLRIYESSKKFKEAQAAKDKEETQKETEKQAAYDNLATLKAAVAITGDTGGEGFDKGLQAARSKVGLSAEKADRLRELEEKKERGETLNESEAQEYIVLNQREEAELSGKVDRKRLIRMVAASGKDLTKDFSAEEIEEYEKEKAEAKENFIAAGGTEGQYSLFQKLDTMDVLGQELSDKEKEGLEAYRSKAATKKKEKKVLPGLHAKEEDIDVKFAHLKAQGEEFVRGIKEREKAFTPADIGTLREIDALKERGMSDEDIRRRYGDKLDLYNSLEGAKRGSTGPISEKDRAAAEKSYREMAEANIGKGSIERKREELGEIGRAMSDEEIKKILVEEVVAGNMENFDRIHGKPVKKTGEMPDLSEPNPVPKDVIEGFGTETKGKGKGDKTKAAKAREAAEKSYREMAEANIGKGSIERKREELGEIGRAMSDEEIKKVLVEENVKERMAGYDARTGKKGKKKSSGVVEAEVPIAPAPSASSTSGGAQAAVAPISEIVKAAGKGAPSTMAAVAEKAESAETAAASGSSSRAKEKSGGEEGGGNVSVGNVTVNQTFNFKDQEGTPEHLSQASKEGALQGVSEAVAEAAPSQNKY